jgi:two-component system, OmpR family, sensor kinase
VRALRTRLFAAVMAAVTIAFVALIAGFNLVLASQLSHDADAVLRARASAELTSLNTSGGHLTVNEAPDQAALESDAWVYSGSRLLESPRANPETNKAAAALAGGPRRRVELPDQDVRLYAVPVVAGGKRLGTVVAGVSLVSYEHTQHVALVASLALVGVLLVVVALVARWMLALALRPVARMTAQAADWSEHDLDRRFGLGEPHDELTTLAATLDHLMERVAASLRHEQRFSSEISHELRTPLAKVRAEAELALRHERSDESYRQALRRVLAGADQMERIIDTLLAVAREEASSRHGTADAAEAALRAAESCSDAARSRGIEIEVASAGAAGRVATESDLVERILVPVIENACRYGKSTVTVTYAGRNSTVTYTVTDDGPGVTEAEHEQIFEPGTRGSAGRNGGGVEGAGLGLSLARRLARAARGDVEAHPDARGGRFTIVLPSV